MANIQPVHSPCYCINYRRAANTLTKYYDAAFAPIGLTGNQFFLLNSIQQLGSCNKSELAQYTSLDRTTIIRNLDTLLKKELVEPAPGANRRHSAIQLSENGRNAFTSGLSIWQTLQDQVQQVLMGWHGEKAVGFDGIDVGEEMVQLVMGILGRIK